MMMVMNVFEKKEIKVVKDPVEKRKERKKEKIEERKEERKEEKIIEKKVEKIVETKIEKIVKKKVEDNDEGKKLVIEKIEEKK